MAGRQLYLALHLLDRQLVDRKSRLAGKVDDLELERQENGDLHVTAILTGPGVLTRRFNRNTLGRWLERAHALLSGGPAPASKIPLSQVVAIGNHVDLSVDREDLATFASERWVLDHIIGHIPGARHAPE
jgi:hypothetical protein